LAVTGQLLVRGIPARLIQSNDRFRLSSLQEVRFFMEQVDAAQQTGAIEKSVWEASRKRLGEVFGHSSNMDLCLKMLDDFEKMYPGVRYKTDLRIFIEDSRLEDFYSTQGGDNREVIQVSTIHKAKGKEF